MSILTMIKKTYKCPKCSVSYHIVPELPTRGEHTRCGDCSLPFKYVANGKVYMYVTKDDLAKFENGE